MGCVESSSSHCGCFSTTSDASSHHRYAVSDQVSQQSIPFQKAQQQQQHMYTAASSSTRKSFRVNSTAGGDSDDAACEQLPSHRMTSPSHAVLMDGFEVRLPFVLRSPGAALPVVKGAGWTQLNWGAAVLQDGLWHATQSFLVLQSTRKGLTMLQQNSFVSPPTAAAAAATSSGELFDRLSARNIVIWNKLLDSLRSPSTTSRGAEVLLAPQMNLRSSSSFANNNAASLACTLWPTTQLHRVDLERRGSSSHCRTRATVTSDRSCSPSAPFSSFEGFSSLHFNDGSLIASTWLVDPQLAILFLEEAVRRYPTTTTVQGESFQAKKLVILSDPSTYLKETYGKLTIAFAAPQESLTNLIFPVARVSSMGEDHRSLLQLKSPPFGPSAGNAAPVPDLLLHTTAATANHIFIDLSAKDQGISEEKLYHRMLHYAKSFKKLSDQANAQLDRDASFAFNTLSTTWNGMTRSNSLSHLQDSLRSSPKHELDGTARSSAKLKRKSSSKRQPQRAVSIEEEDVDEFLRGEDGTGYKCEEPTPSEAVRRLIRRTTAAKLNIEDDDMIRSLRSSTALKIGSGGGGAPSAPTEVECLRFMDQRTLPAGQGITISVDCDPPDQGGDRELQKSVRMLSPFKFPVDSSSRVSTPRMLSPQLFPPPAEEPPSSGVLLSPSAAAAATRRRDSNPAQSLLLWQQQQQQLSPRVTDVDISNCSTPTLLNPGSRRRSDTSLYQPSYSSATSRHYVLVGAAARAEAIAADYAVTAVPDTDTTAKLLEVAKRTVHDMQAMIQREHIAAAEDEEDETATEATVTPTCAAAQVPAPAAKSIPATTLGWYQALCCQSALCPIEGIVLVDRAHAMEQTEPLSLLTGLARVRGEQALAAALNAYRSQLERKCTTTRSHPADVVSAFDDCDPVVPPITMDPLLLLACNDTDKWDTASSLSSTLRLQDSHNNNNHSDGKSSFSGWGATPRDEGGSFNEPPAMANPFFSSDPCFMDAMGCSPMLPLCSHNNSPMLPGQVGEEESTATPSQSMVAHMAATVQQLDVSVPLPTVFWPPPPSPPMHAQQPLSSHPARRVGTRDRRSSLASNHTSPSDNSDALNSSHPNQQRAGALLAMPPSLNMHSGISHSAAAVPDAVPVVGWKKKRQTSCQRLLQRYQLIQELQNKGVFEWVVGQARWNHEPDSLSEHVDMVEESSFMFPTF